MGLSEIEARGNGVSLIRRRLVAIVFADVVGFSALIGHDDAGTFGRIRLLRAGLVVPEVEKFRGKVIHTAGDAFLLAFGSIMDAVNCAGRLQRLISRYDGDHPPDRRLRLRIGITIGDVLSDGTDIHGNDVNIAARLQAACPGGAICVSRAIYERVKGRVDAVVDELGELRLKNIAQPVEAFVLHLSPDVMLPDGADGEPLDLHVPNTAPAGPLRFRPERCQITVLSIEMVQTDQYTGVGDPEEVRSAIEVFRRRVREIASQHGGSLSQTSAREMQAHFGFPVAQEDAAERAVCCALMLADRRVRPASSSDTRFGLRVGIATGQVVAEPQGEIVGDAPAEAARLRSFSGQGVVVADAATVRMVGGLFEYRALPGTSSAGTAGAPCIWEILGSSLDVSRFEARQRGKLLPLFGREEELSLLLRRWRKARQGEGEAVLLSGEPGIGKSRLVRALADGIAQQPHRKLEYCCSARYRNSALHPVIQQIRKAAGITAGDDDGTKFAKLERHLQPLTVSSESLFLTADLLGIRQHARSGQQVSPHRKKDKTLDVLLEQFAALAAQDPIMLVAEDLHWMDPTSTELLARLVARLDRLPALLVMTARPGFVPPWPEYAHTKILPLTRLSRGEGVAFAAELARDHAVPAESLKTLVARSEGIPLFIEELTKNLIEERVPQNERGPRLDAPPPRPVLPATLQVSLMARLDRFVSAKQIAQVGAVIGREFFYDLLAAVEDLPEDKLRSGLAQLVRSELVFVQGSPPDSVYTFKHALVQEAAYESLLRSDRRRLHRAIARALQNRRGETVGGHPELLAYHCAEAGLTKEAAAHWLEAGQLSLHLCMMAEAEIQMQRGIDLLGGMPDCLETTALEFRLQIALTRARILTRGFASAETAAASTRAKQLWERLGSPPDLAGPVIYGQWFISIVRVDLDVAAEIAAQLRTVADLQNDSCLRAMAVYYHAIILNLRGQFPEALEGLSSALAMQDPACESIYETFQAHHPRLSILMQLSRTLAYMGFPEQARAASQTALAQARAGRNPQTLAYMLTLGFLSGYAFCRPAELLWDARELMTVAEEHRFPQYLTAGRAAYGWCLVKSGETQEGLDLLAGSFGNTQTGTRLYEPFRLALVADAWGSAGQPQTGLKSLDEAFEMMESTDERWAEAELHRVRGELLAGVDDKEAASRSFATAMRVAQCQKAKAWEVRAAASLARLWGQEGRHAEALALVGPVVDWFTEGQDTALLADMGPLL